MILLDDQILAIQWDDELAMYIINLPCELKGATLIHTLYNHYIIS